MTTNTAPAARFVSARHVKVGDVRVVGGVITAIRESKSGQTVWLTNSLGTERLPAGTRVAIRPAVPLFDLYVPASNVGPTHLHTDGITGILCGSARRYSTFVQQGIVPAGSATCEDCNRIAQALVIEAIASH